MYYYFPSIFFILKHQKSLLTKTPDEIRRDVTEINLR